MMKIYIRILPLLLIIFTGPVSGAQKDAAAFTLAEAQAYALNNSNTVENARLDVEAASKRIWENAAMGMPQVSAGGQYTNNLQLMTTLIPAEIFQGEAGTFIPVKFGTQHNATANIIANQLLFSGTYIVGLQAASTYKDLTKRNLKKQEADIKEAVAQSYYSILLAEAGKDAFGKNLETMKQRLAETEAMHTGGFLEETDVDQIQIAVSTLENEYIAAGQMVDLSYRFLVYQMGMHMGAEIAISENLEDIIEGLTDDLIRQEFDVNRHYDYRIMETQERLAHMQVKLNQSEYMPTLAAFLNHQQMAMRDDFNLFDTEEKWYPATMVGISIDIPIFSSGMRRAKVGQSKIEFEKTRNMKEDLATALEMGVQQARINFRTAYRKYLNEKSNIELAQKIFDRTSVKYNSGVVSSLELTMATEQLTASQAGYISTIVDLLNAKLALDKALGNL